MGDFSLADLQVWGIAVARQPGRITSRQKCGVCGAKGKFTLRTFGDGPGQVRMLFCSECGRFPATHHTIKIKWQKKWRYITHDQQGEKLATYAQAEAALGEIRRQVRAKSFNPAYWRAAKTNQLLWSNFRKKYLEVQARRVAAGEISRATLDKRRAAQKHLAWFDKMSIREINAGHIQDWLAQMTLAPKTKRDLISELGQMFGVARERELIDRTPKLPRVAVNQKSPAWLGEEAQNAILDELPPEHQPIFLFMMTYGCRPSEAIALNWRDVDLKNSTFTIRRTMSRRKMGSATKQRRDNPQPIVAWLEEYLGSAPRGLPDQPVFRNLLSRKNRHNPERRYTLDSLGGEWKKAAGRAGYPGIRLYNGVRHSLVNQLLRREIDPARIARIVGHADTKYIIRNYSDMDSELVRSTLEGRRERRGSTVDISLITSRDNK